MIPGLGQVKLVAAALLVAAFASLGFFAKWQYDRANGLSEKLAASETARKADLASFQLAKGMLEQSISALEKARESDQAQLKALAATHDRIVEERDEIRSKYDGYRDRIGKAALAKPGRVGDLATRASERLFLAIQRASRADPDHYEGGGNPAVPSAPPGSRTPAR